MTPGQTKILTLMVEEPKGLIGPAPTYQGDYVHCTGPDMQDLIARKLVSFRMIEPRDTDGHIMNPPYLQFTHRYKIRAAGRRALAACTAGK